MHGVDYGVEFLFQFQNRTEIGANGIGQGHYAYHPAPVYHRQVTDTDSYKGGNVLVRSGHHWIGSHHFFYGIVQGTAFEQLS